MAEKSFSVRLLANISQYKAAMADAGRSTDKFASESDRKLSKLGKSMSDVGGKMTTRLTLPLVAAGGAAVKMFINFDESMTKIQSLVGLSASEVDGMRDSVMGLAGETSRSPQELADALFVVTSAGLRGSEALDTLEVAAKASAAGLGDTATIARAVAGAVNAYGPDVLSAAEATDVLTATARAGNFETSQLAGALGRVLPFAKQAQTGLDDVGGAIALLTRTNGNAAESITQIQGLMRSFVVPTAEAVKILGDMGLSAEDVRDKIGEDGLVAALEMLDSGLGGNREQLGRLIGSSEGASAAFQILDADAKTIEETFGAVASSTGIVDEAFATTAETGAFALRQSWAEVQTALIEAGEIIVPVLADIAGGVADLLAAFSTLPQPVQEIVVGVLAFVAAAGPLLVVAGKLVQSFAAVKAAAVGANLAVLAGPLGAVALGLGIVAAAWIRTGQNADDAAKRAAQSAEDMAARVDDLAARMEQAGSSSEGLRGHLVDMVRENDTLRESMVGAGVDIDEMVSKLELGADSGDFIVMLRRIYEEAVNIGASADEAAALNDMLRQLSIDTKNANEDFQELGITTGDTTDAATEIADEFDAVAEAMFASGEGGELVTVTDHLGREFQVAAGMAEEWQAEIDALAEAQQEFIDIVMDSISTMFDYESTVLSLENAYEDFQGKIYEVGTALENGTLTTEEAERAKRDLRLEEIALAEQALGSAEAFAAESGAIDGSAESARLQVEELLRQREQYPFLRDEIDLYIKELGYIPDAIPTDIQALIDEGKYAEALRRLDELDNPRSTTLTVRINQEGTVTLPGGAQVRGRGGIRDTPELAVWAEDGREAILPLTKPNDLDAIVSDSRVMAPLLSSLSRIGGPQDGSFGSGRLQSMASMGGAQLSGGRTEVVSEVHIHLADGRQVKGMFDERDADLLRSLEGGLR